MLIFTTIINDVDDRAFMQEVYQQNERLMYAIALKHASNTQDCEDIVHDTVEKLCKNIAKIKELPFRTSGIRSLRGQKYGHKF